MKAAVVTFPGSNCDRDLAVAFERAGFDVARVWHKDSALPAGEDVFGIPGGFSLGDYLRCGALAAQSPVAGAVRDHAAGGGCGRGLAVRGRNGPVGGWRQTRVRAIGAGSAGGRGSG